MENFSSRGEGVIQVSLELSVAQIFQEIVTPHFEVCVDRQTDRPDKY